MTDAQLGVALYRVIADPETIGFVDDAHLIDTFTEVAPEKLGTTLAQLVDYGAIHRVNDKLWEPVPYEPA